MSTIRDEINKEKDKEQLRNQLPKIIELADMGGFIKDAIEDIFYAAYSNEIADALLKYNPFDRLMISVANRVQREVHIYDLSRSRRGETNPFEKPFVPERKQSIPQELKGFLPWFVDTLVRYETKKARGDSDDHAFWKNWSLSQKNRRAMETLNALDERVYYLKSGLDTGLKRSNEEVAEKLETSEWYTQMIWEILTRKLEAMECDSDELNRVCGLARREALQKNQR